MELIGTDATTPGYVITVKGPPGDPGNATGPNSAVAGEVTVYADTTGHILGRANQTGIAKLAAGVLGTAAPGTDYYQPTGTDVAVTDGGTGASTASAARTNLGVAIGTNVQAHDADLDTIAALTPADNDVLQRKSGAWINRTPAQLKTDQAFVKADVGLGSVDNTADGAKAVLSATKLTTARNINGVAFDGTANITVADSTKEATANKNVASGYCPLGSDVMVPEANLRSYHYANLAAFPGTGLTGRIYVALDTGFLYRWSGSAYVALTAQNTNSLAEGSTNLYYTDARADARVTAGITGKANTTTTISTGTGLTGGGDLSGNRSLAVSYGTTSTTACVGNDSRLSDTRTPTNSTVSLAKLTATGTQDATTFLRGDNTFAVPPSAITGNALTAAVATAETTASTTYTDLATTTDTVTLSVPSSGKVLVIVSAVLSSATVNPSTMYASFAVSGANTVAASDTNAMQTTNSNVIVPTRTVLLTGLSTGSTTFKMKYKVTTGTMGLQNRSIIVIPL